MILRKINQSQPIKGRDNLNKHTDFILHEMEAIQGLIKRIQTFIFYDYYYSHLILQLHVEIK